ncbi:MAG TPA: endonuclease V [Nitriliruptorales bacterium]|nr:endonuclease V [Nitriliruptorales bacterium]
MATGAGPGDTDRWPTAPDALVALQQRLSVLADPAWQPEDPQASVAASYICFRRGVGGPGAAGDRAWAGAALKLRGRPSRTVVVTGGVGGPYIPGLLALREGPLRCAAVSALDGRPGVLIVDATGRDHPRRAGLALHLGWAQQVPSVGATHRPLLASGAWPEDRRGATQPLTLDGEVVGHWVRTRPGVRPLAVHAGWRTSPEVAVEVVLGAARRARTPQPLRAARRAARTARSRA